MNREDIQSLIDSSKLLVITEHFKPTYLYIKTHNVTGLKYFGKTTNSNVESYKGSGVHWNNHLRKYGNSVTTEIYGFYENPDLLIEEAILFSIENDIVKSEKWANLKFENGVDGGALPGEQHPLYNKKRPRQSELMTGDNNPAKRESHKLNHHAKTQEWRDRISKLAKENNCMRNPEVAAKVSAALSGKPRPKARKPKPKYSCKHCGGLFAMHILVRFHDRKCKYIGLSQSEIDTLKYKEQPRENMKGENNPAFGSKWLFENNNHLKCFVKKDDEKLYNALLQNNWCLHKDNKHIKYISITRNVWSYLINE